MNRTVKRRLLTVGMIGVASLIGTLASPWAVRPVFGDRPSTDFRHIFPHRLIESTIWPGHTDDSPVFQSINEARARFLILGLSWFLVVTIILYKHGRDVRALKA